MRWFEFLSFHVARRIPAVPDLIRQFAPLQFQEVFGYQPELEADRFAHHDDFDAAFAEYVAEPPVRILFESGAGHEVAGRDRRTATRCTPSRSRPPGSTPRRWWLARRRPSRPTRHPTTRAPTPTSTTPPPARTAYSSELLVDLTASRCPRCRSRGPASTIDHRVAYETDDARRAARRRGPGQRRPVARPRHDRHVGAGHADRDPARRPRAARAVRLAPPRSPRGGPDPQRRAARRLHVLTRGPRPSSMPGEWIHFRVPIYPFTHVFRKGTRLRLAISTPGRDHPFWCFESPGRRGCTPPRRARRRARIVARAADLGRAGRPPARPPARGFAAAASPCERSSPSRTPRQRPRRDRYGRGDHRGLRRPRLPRG